MSKGMSMEEFREALSSEATIENEKLKKELEDLKKSTSETIKTLEYEKEVLMGECKNLSSRCMAYTSGNICISCNIKNCDFALSESDMNKLIMYMKKNKIDKNTTDGFVKASNYIATLKLKQINEMLRKNKEDK